MKTTLTVSQAEIATIVENYLLQKFDKVGNCEFQIMSSSQDGPLYYPGYVKITVDVEIGDIDLV